MPSPPRCYTRSDRTCLRPLLPDTGVGLHNADASNSSESSRILLRAAIEASRRAMRLLSPRHVGRPADDQDRDVRC